MAVSGGVKTRAKTVVYGKFCGADVGQNKGVALVASSARNCDFENGALRCGFGAQRYYLDAAPDRNVAAGATVYGIPKMVFTVLNKSTSDGIVRRTIGAQSGVNRIFVYDYDSDVVKHVLMPKTLHRALSYVYPDGTTKMIFCCADQLFLYDFVNKQTKLLTDTLTSACWFHERLFVSNKDTIKYTAPMDLPNFDVSFNGGGEIKFYDDRGELVWLEDLGESMYVFFQYGIAKMTADGAGSEFVLEDIPYGGDHIISRTVCTYGHKLVFAAYDGIYVFDGKKCSAVKGFRYAPLKKNTLVAYAACVGSRYFLYYVDEENQKRSLAVDLEDQSNTSEYFLLHGLNQSGGKALCACDYVYSYLDPKGDLPKGEQYLFEANDRDFGSPNEKALKYLSLQGTGRCSLTVSGRSGSRMVEFDLGEGEGLNVGNGLGENVSNLVGCARKRIGLRGRKFSFSITLEKGCVIRKMTVEYDELGGEK